MDARHVDALTRFLTVGWHRHALVAARGAVLAPELSGSDVTAHNPLKKCRKIDDSDHSPVSVRSCHHSRQEAPVENTRFDDIARALGSLTTRRQTFGALLGGALSTLGLAQPEDVAAAKSGKCKPKCGECERCKRGDCNKKDGKTRCQKGKCKPKADETGCSVGTCQGGRCVAAPPPPPPPFCAGKNTCVDIDIACNQPGTAECVCYPTAASGAPHCGLDVVDVQDCAGAAPADPCAPGERCVDVSACIPGATGCSPRCPSPL
jgi:hypothetical protein